MAGINNSLLKKLEKLSALNCNLVVLTIILFLLWYGCYVNVQLNWQRSPCFYFFLIFPCWSGLGKRKLFWYSICWRVFLIFYDQLEIVSCQLHLESRLQFLFHKLHYLLSFRVHMEKPYTFIIENNVHVCQYITKTQLIPFSIFKDSDLYLLCFIHTQFLGL